MIEQNKYKWIENTDKQVIAMAYIELETELRLTKLELERTRNQLREALQKAYNIKLAEDKPEDKKDERKPLLPPRPPQQPPRPPPRPPQQGSLPRMPPVGGVPPLPRG